MQFRQKNWENFYIRKMMIYPDKTRKTMNR